MTGTALPLSLAHVDVTRGIGMALRAVRFLGIDCRRTVPTQHILPMSHKLQMRRVHAGRDTAKMVNISLPVRFSIGKYEGVMTGNNTMPCNADTNKAKDTIPSMIERGSPQPTRAEVRTIRWNRPILVDFGPKAALDARKGWTPSKWVSVPNKAHVMALAIALPIAEPLASFNLACVSHMPIVPESMVEHNMRVVS